MKALGLETQADNPVLLIPTGHCQELAHCACLEDDLKTFSSPRGMA